MNSRDPEVKSEKLLVEAKDFLSSRKMVPYDTKTSKSESNLQYKLKKYVTDSKLILQKELLSISMSLH